MHIATTLRVFSPVSLGHPFTQQRLKDLKPNVNINSLLVIYFVAALLFISTGCVLNSNSRSDIHEYVIKYDGSATDYPSCSISQSNIAKSCQVRKQDK